MKKTGFLFLIVSLLLVCVFIYSAITGSIHVTPIELLEGLIIGQHAQVEIIKDLRIPRVLIAMFTGAALSVSGVLLQSVMRNPLADLRRHWDFIRSQLLFINGDYSASSILFLLTFIFGIRRGDCVFPRVRSVLEGWFKPDPHDLSWDCHQCHVYWDG